MEQVRVPIDQLKACDIVYDSSVTEFVLGKKRVMIPLSLAQIDIEKGASGDDTISPSFDPNDMLFYVINAREGQDGKPIEIDMHLRVAEHDAALQRQIDLLSKKCGLGMGRYQVDGGALKTATEVISAKSDLYQSLKRHEKAFKDAIVGMVKAIGWLQGVQVQDVAVQFDDSIIEDANATIDREIKLVSAGLTSKKEAIMAIEGVDEKAAEAKLQAIAAEERINIDAAEAAMFGRMG
jgi:A118 family predicted phage portal protein